jgi:hypothetical protein
MWIRTTEGLQGQCPLLFPLKQEKKDLQSSKKTDAPQTSATAFALVAQSVACFALTS